MPFIPHTEQDVASMLAELGINSTDELFKEIPESLELKQAIAIDDAINEQQAKKILTRLAAKDNYDLNFIGAGSYEHHIPAAVWELATRGEFLTCYTPYQAEAAQGTLQVLYEYQTMMANLMALDVSNASMYDGASALAEAILLAIRANSKAKGKAKTVLLPATVHPWYRQVVPTIVGLTDVEIVEIPFDLTKGIIDINFLDKFKNQDILALVIPQPNFFGLLEEVHVLTNWAKSKGALVIGLVNPLAMALLSPPGEWGETGADIACGEAQPLGVPMCSGGPYIGFICCQEKFIRQLPGRIVGKTKDTAGNVGFTLTLQTREQHIRRAKATSNICTNQGLLATVVTIYMSLLGANGLKQVATCCYLNAVKLKNKVKDKLLFTNDNFFHELAIKFKEPVELIQQRLVKQKIQAGFDLSIDYPELGNGLLCCVTETKTQDEIELFSNSLE